MLVNKRLDDKSTNTLYEIFVSREETLSFEAPVKALVIDAVTKKITEDFLEKHYLDVMSKISPEVIANLVVAKAAAIVNESLNNKFADCIHKYEEGEMKNEY